MAARMASVVDGVGDGGGMMRMWCRCGDKVRGAVMMVDNMKWWPNGGGKGAWRRVSMGIGNRSLRITFVSPEKSAVKKFSGGARQVADPAGGGGWPIV
ncbi:hypothetical protein Tco_0796849 [Tanacetum coccineum]